MFFTTALTSLPVLAFFAVFAILSVIDSASSYFAIAFSYFFNPFFLSLLVSV